MLNHSRDKNEGTHPVVGGGEEGPLCDPGSVTVEREGESTARIINGTKKNTHTPTTELRSHESPLCDPGSELLLGGRTKVLRA